MIEAKIDPDKKIMFFLAFVLIIVGIGYTYSYFSSRDSSEDKTITTGTLSIKYTENEEGIINADNIAPILDENIFDSATKLSFDVENTGNINASYNIKLTNLTIDTELANADFKLAIYTADTLVSSGDFSKAVTGTDYSLIQDKSLETGSNTDYTLYIWISETNTNQDTMKDKSFEAKVEVDATKA